VVYNKGALLPPTPGLLPPVEYSYSQKPASFQTEREFRYVLTLAADRIRLQNAATRLRDHLILNLPDCSDISSLG
jgi:hypothetical protein